MSLNIKTAKIAGNPDDNGCSQAYDIQPENPSRSNSHGELHLVVSIKGIGDNSQSIFVIRGIVAQIQKKYYDNLEDKILKALSNAISSTLETYQKEIEIASAVILNDHAHIVTYGTAEVWLKRADKLAVFRSPNGAISKFSGKLHSEDLLILATHSFVKDTSSAELKEVLEKDDPQDIVGSLAPGVQSKDSRSTICAMFIKTGQSQLTNDFSDSNDYPKINAPAHYTQLANNENKRSQDELEPNEPQKPKRSFFAKLKKKRLYVQEFQDEKANKRRRLFSFAGIVLIAALAGTVTYGLFQKKEKERVEKIEAVVATIEKDLQEAEEVFSFSPQRSQELVERSREELKKLEDPELKAQDQVAALTQRIDSAQGNVLGMHNAEIDDFLDLNLLSNGFSGDKLIVYSGVLYVLDDENDRLIRVEVSSKRSEIHAGPDVMDGVTDVAVWSNDVFLLKQDGVYDLEDNNILNKDWSNNTLVRTYAGNVYFLDKQNSEIIRYAISNGDLNSRTSWLSSEVSADFSKITSWGIDGAIWLSSDSGSVFKYTYGYQQNFELGKVSPELSSGTIIYANADNERVYLLDKENARILVFEKEGEYVEQYNEDVIKDARDLAVFEDEGKIILLTGDKLKQIEIK